MIQDEFSAIPCKTARYRARNPERARRSYRLAAAKKFGLTAEQFDALVEIRGNTCWICNAPESRRGRYSMCIDHDHTTGRVRGLLCFDCNEALGRFKDDPQLIAKAIEYLKGNRWGM